MARPCRFPLIAVFATFAGCGGATDEPAPKPKVTVLETATPGTSDQEALARAKGWELRKFDLNRDNKADIFKFFVSAQDPKQPGEPLLRLIRKEIDINHDGKIDVVRLFNDDEEMKEELIDLDFDGRFDELSYFKQGEVVRKEVDLDYDGVADLKKYYREGRLQRVESDRNSDGKVETWEYYENEQLDRIGTDNNGDGEVDAWEVKREKPAAEATGDEAPEDGAATEPTGDGDDGADAKPDED